MRANARIPATLERDKRDEVNVAVEHPYSNIVSDDSSSGDEDVEEVAAHFVEPIIDVGDGVFYDGDISQELCVAQQETVGEDTDSAEEENDWFEDALEDNLNEENSQDPPFLCSSQHSMDESSCSQECSQKEAYVR